MDPFVPPRTRGEIITFYSYKGGTGRTMALANVACLLAERAATRQSVLVVDWDLEAPGLHRFLPPRLVSQNAGMDLGLDATPGLIDIFTALAEKLPPDRPGTEEEADRVVRDAFSSIAFESFIADTAVPGVSILRAGRNDDGEYSRRVNTFDWEELFNRAPGVYRALADRLGETFQYVLIDSRTGVTDISGICTSLLPEKLVVVFTPNRQSLTGVRELVERATSYRRNSDDLRPLLIYPLPSRIEASLQELRTLWRLGSRDRNVVGYEPMFEELFVKNYGLPTCDLSAYFDDVQIQQTPDYAYGEEIAVRRGSDRFSLANSYRVFVDHLVGGSPPWLQAADGDLPATDAVAATSIRPSGAAPSIPLSPTPDKAPSAAAAASARPKPAAVAVSPPSRSAAVEAARSAPPAGVAAAPPSRAKSGDAAASPGDVPSPPIPVISRRSASSAREAKRSSVFLSVAEEDRDRVKPIAAALARHGFHVWDLRSMPAGTQFDRALADALDNSDVVIVCWTKGSIGSESVLDEASEGLQRGILVPVLLDDVRPPLAFRAIQSADLRRDIEGGMPTLIEAVSLIARGLPGTISPPVFDYGSGVRTAGSADTVMIANPKAGSRRLWSWVAAAAGIVLTVSVFSVGRFKREQTVVPPPGDPTIVQPPSNIGVGQVTLPPPTVGAVRVPDFKGEQTDDVLKAAGRLGLQIVFKDENGKESPSLEGVVVDQSPRANEQVARGSSLRLTVATATVTVPTIVGGTLDQAVLALDKARLRIATAGERLVPDVKPGTVVAQSPVAGVKAAVGSRISVTIATSDVRQ